MASQRLRKQEELNGNNSDKDKKNNKKENYYTQFNSREEEIAKDKNGIALKSQQRLCTSEADESWHNEEDNESESRLYFSQNQTVPMGLNSAEVTVKNLTTKLIYYIDKDSELRRIVWSMLEGSRRVDPEVERFGIEEDDRIKEEFSRKKKMLKDQEERRKERVIVQEIKKQYWKRIREGEHDA